MKRDMDLIKAILLFVEDNERSAFSVKWAAIEDYFGVSGEVFRYHIGLLQEAGLMKASFTSGGPSFQGLTNQGHNFLDDARNDTVWNAAKTHAKEASFEAFRDAVKAFATGTAITILRSVGMG